MPVNIKNPAIKRIHADVRELMKDPSDQYHAAPLESNLFEWHFTIRGPPDTEFEGGVYHGRIILPPEYPFRPPDIIFNTPNGRFSTGMKVCLTISSYHPEHWQPAWGIRLILEALISFFPSPSQGALGGLDWSPEERKRLAADSVGWKCYKCGVADDLLPELRPKGSGGGGGGGSSGASSGYADQIKALHKLRVKTAEEVAAESVAEAPPGGGGTAAAAAGSDGGGGHGTKRGVAGQEGGGIIGGAVSGKQVSGSAETSVETSVAAPEATTTAVAPSSPRLRRVSGAPAEGGGESTPSPAADGASSRVSMGEGEGELDGDGQQQQQQRRRRRQQQQQQQAVVESTPAEREDDVLSFVAVAIALAIIGILVKKALRLLDVF